MKLFSYREYTTPLESYYVDVVKFKEHSLFTFAKEEGFFDDPSFLLQLGGDQFFETTFSVNGWVYSFSLLNKHYDWEVPVGGESQPEDNSGLHTTDNPEKGV